MLPGLRPRCLPFAQRRSGRRFRGCCCAPATLGCRRLSCSFRLVFDFVVCPLCALRRPLCFPFSIFVFRLPPVSLSGSLLLPDSVFARLLLIFRPPPPVPPRSFPLFPPLGVSPFFAPFASSCSLFGCVAAPLFLSSCFPWLRFAPFSPWLGASFFVLPLFASGCLC